MAATKVKICGVTSVEDALMVAAAGADAVGLNFAPRSPRCVTLDVAAAIAVALPEEVCRVGVFMDAARETVQSIAERVGLDALQFHGDEAPELCAGWDRKTIKALRVRGPESLRQAERYDVDYILADAYVEGGAGGTGTRVPIAWLRGVPPLRLIVAGGLTPENVIEVIRAVAPAGVDVASGVERAPGRKDPEKVERFIANARIA